jgi:probable rRNA maturation factor
VLVSDARGRTVPAGGLSAWLRRVAPPGARGTVNVALVTDARMRVLNRRYRRKDCATDVLTFPAAPSHPAFARSYGMRATARLATAPKARRRQPPAVAGCARFGAASPATSPCLGDIVIATGVAGRQAREAGHRESTELRILALHGLLHLLGYDHDQDDGRMGRVERRLRRKGGLREGLIERG